MDSRGPAVSVAEPASSTVVNQRLLIRADAGASFGFGHVMRTLALAQYWRESFGPVTYLCRQLSEQLVERLNSEAIDLLWLPQDGIYGPGSPKDAKHTLSVIHEIAPTAIVFDGYKFKTEYQDAIQNGLQQLVKRPTTLLLDDDGRFDRYLTDFVLNQNAGANESLYPNRAANTKLILGSDFTLLRSEFVARVNSSKGQTARPPANLLVTLGGYDPGGVTQRIIDAASLLSQKHLKVTVVSKMEGLRIDDSRIDLVSFTDDMAELYEQADLAVCAGGSTNWEMCFFGIPRLVIVLANNQRSIAKTLDDRGCVRSLDWFEDVSIETISDGLNELFENE